MEKEIIYQGAEAILYSDIIDGKRVVIKERVNKRYRIDFIDQYLKKTRTRREVKLLTEARKFGVNTPQIIDVDESSGKIVMEFIEGIRIKEFLNESENESEISNVCKEIGKNIGILHSNKIVHGDLTTSNMIMRDGKIYFLDFGLGKISNRIEDYGVDLNLLYEAIRSTHFKKMDLIWKNIVEGYEKKNKDAKKILNKMGEIEKRARYMDRNKA